EQEVFAEAELLDGTKFIRLVCLIYISGPTNRAWYAASCRDDACLGAESNLAMFVLTRERLGKPHDFGVRLRIEGRKGGHFLECEAGIPMHFVHAGLQRFLRV